MDHTHFAQLSIVVVHHNISNIIFVEEIHIALVLKVLLQRPGVVLICVVDVIDMDKIPPESSQRLGPSSTERGDDK
jgi:hypothetical protein